MFRAIHAPRSRAKGLTESTQRRLAGPVLTELTTQSPGHTHTHTHTTAQQRKTPQTLNKHPEHFKQRKEATPLVSMLSHSNPEQRAPRETQRPRQQTHSSAITPSALTPTPQAKIRTLLRNNSKFITFSSHIFRSRKQHI